MFVGEDGNKIGSFTRISFLNLLVSLSTLAIYIVYNKRNVEFNMFIAARFMCHASINVVGVFIYVLCL